ncbi:glycoside hydrolase family 38 C-terminal domain-containing protein [Halegenticoccus tardaugens]|uniref:glycoside hydrolase family 38 C-terminal domain-containing protein n=1 Tax=Halegenticoccus tardaugens TaxID=2071624 RepID=UPI00100C0B3C|nr:glycoside hydrolase family 38 C-terminal domain-containing protein [Halegenticoccus tardaugens]
MSDEFDRVLITNPLPWERTISGPVSKYAVEPRGRGDDDLSARHWQDRSFNDNAYLLPPTDVPGYGYAVVPTGDLTPNEGWPFDERHVVETDDYRITFDRERGGITSWRDKRLDCEWVDEAGDYPLAGIVRERLADSSDESPRDRLFRAPPAGEDNPDGLWNAAPDLVEAEAGADNTWEAPTWGYQRDWHAERYGPERVLRHRVYRTPHGYDVRQTLSVEGLDSTVDLRVTVPHEGTEVVAEATWEESRATHPASTYLVFPFDLPEPRAHVDVGGQAVRPGTDQLAGTCRDYYTVQRWVELSNEQRGVTVGCPLNPMVQLGDFRFGEHNREFSLDWALLLGWVSTNYYNTNFRAHQPGRVRARYHLHPHDGPFDEGRAHTVGAAAEQATPLVQPIAEVGSELTLPERGRVLDLPEPPVLVCFVRPSRAAGIGDASVGGADSVERTAGGGADEFDVGLLNASDEDRTATVTPGVFSVEAARTVGLLGEDDRRRSLGTSDGAVEVDLTPRELRVVRLSAEVSR